MNPRQSKEQHLRAHACVHRLLRAPSMLTSHGRDKKWLRRGPGAWVGWMGMQGLRVLVPCLPLRWIPSLGQGLGRAMYRFMGSRRGLALKNMSLAFGAGMDPKTRRRLLRSLLNCLGTTVLELVHPDYLRLEVLRRYVAVQGREHLDGALARGKGAILVTAHFGNFPLMLARLSLEGYKVGVIVRDPRHPPTARFLDRWRAGYGIITLHDKPRWASAREALGLLLSNGVLFLHMDLNVSRGGIWVPFFRHRVPTFRGPAVLSLRSGAPALPVFIRRIHGLHHRMVIHPPLDSPRTGDREEDTCRMIEGLTRAAENTIRQYPQHWWWIHRRFRKAQPFCEGAPLPAP